MSALKQSMLIVLIAATSGCATIQGLNDSVIAPLGVAGAITMWAEVADEVAGCPLGLDRALQDKVADQAPASCKQ